MYQVISKKVFLTFQKVPRKHLVCFKEVPGSIHFLHTLIKTNTNMLLTLIFFILNSIKPFFLNSLLSIPQMNLTLLCLELETSGKYRTHWRFYEILLIK